MSAMLAVPAGVEGGRGHVEHRHIHQAGQAHRDDDVGDGEAEDAPCLAPPCAATMRSCVSAECR